MSEALLFKVEDCAAVSKLAVCRLELEKALNEALAACDDVPDHYLDRDRAKEIFNELAKDGDADSARDQIRMSFEMDGGFGRHFDCLLDHVNCVAFAFWMLRRSKERELSARKEGAR